MLLLCDSLLRCRNLRVVWCIQRVHSKQKRNISLTIDYLSCIKCIVLLIHRPYPQFPPQNFRDLLFHNNIMNYGRLSPGNSSICFFFCFNGTAGWFQSSKLFEKKRIAYDDICMANGITHFSCHHRLWWRHPMLIATLTKTIRLSMQVCGQSDLKVNDDQSCPELLDFVGQLNILMYSIWCFVVAKYDWF